MITSEKDFSREIRRGADRARLMAKLELLADINSYLEKGHTPANALELARQWIEEEMKEKDLL